MCANELSGFCEWNGPPEKPPPDGSPRTPPPPPPGGDARADRRPAPVWRRLLRRAVPLAEPRELVFAHIPGLKCVCPATPEDAKGLLISAIDDPNPVLYFEHKHLYRRIKAEVPEERYTVPIGKARIHREGDDVSLITWGAMVYTADEAATQLEDDRISVEIVDLRTVLPWDKEAVLESVRKTSKALVLHEDTHTGGFGAEILATIAEEAFEDLDWTGAPDHRAGLPVPFSPPLEKAYIPQVEDVVAGVRELAEY